MSPPIVLRRNEGLQMLGEHSAGQLSGIPRNLQAPVETDTTRRLIRLLKQVDDLLATLSHAESSWAGWLSAVAPERRPGQAQ